MEDRSCFGAVALLGFRYPIACLLDNLGGVVVPRALGLRGVAISSCCLCASAAVAPGRAGRARTAAASRETWKYE